MPAKVYVDAPPAGDFRAMPARGDGLATLKWVTSFPHNPERGLPVVAGALLVSSAETGELLAIMDCAAITSLRTGAAAAVSALALAREDARSVGVIGCGVNGAWAARCLAAAGYGPGVCADPRRGRGRRRSPPSSAGGRGSREAAAAQDVVVTVTPADRAGDRAPPTCARASTWRCSAPTPAARPRSSSARSRAAGSSATSGSRRRRAESSRARSPPGAVGRERGDRDRRRAARPRARARARRRRSPSSTRPASRSRTWGSRRRARGLARGTGAGAYREHVTNSPLGGTPGIDSPDGQIAIEDHLAAWFDHIDTDFRATSLNRLVLDLIPGGRILDIGCGSGALSAELLSAGHTVISQDPSERLLALCRAHLRRRQLDDSGVRCGTIDAIPERREFDAVVALDVIEHIEDDIGALTRLRDSLRPSGQLVVSVPALSSAVRAEGRRGRPLPAIRPSDPARSSSPSRVRAADLPVVEPDRSRPRMAQCPTRQTSQRGVPLLGFSDQPSRQCLPEAVVSLV